MSLIMPTREERIAALDYDYAALPKEASAACNICGGTNWTILTHRDRYGFPAPGTYCRDCGLLAINPRLTPAGYADFYQRVYRPLVSAYHGRLIDAKSVQAEQWTYAAEMAELIRPFMAGRPNATFLDVGGSTGIIAAHFAREFGMKGTVIDPAPDEIEEAKALGIEAVTGFVEDWDPAGRTFGVVGMFQTIDHLLDATGTFAKMRRLVADDGLLVVDIVDVRHSALKNRRVEQAVKIDHPFNFSEPVAELLLRRTGFRILRRAVSADHHLVAYVCAPCAPEPDAAPDRAWAETFYRELRSLQAGPQS